MNMKIIEPKLNEIDIKIKNIISNYINIENISINKIRELFYKQNGYYISKAKIFNIMQIIDVGGKKIKIFIIKLILRKNCI